MLRASLCLTMKAVNKKISYRAPIKPEWGLGSLTVEQSNYHEALLIGLFLSILQIVDAILTLNGIQLFGIKMEGNPLLRNMMYEFGYIETLAMVKAVTILAVMQLALLSHRIKWVRAALGTVSFVYLFAAVFPWTAILSRELL